MELSAGQADIFSPNKQFTLIFFKVQVSHEIKFSVIRYFRVCCSKKSVSIFHMDGSKISRRYIINKYFERTKKKMILQ